MTAGLDDLVEHGRVHRRFYTDPEIFNAEMDNIYGRVWLWLIKKINNFFKFTNGGGVDLNNIQIDI